MTYMRAAELLSEVTVLDDPEMAEAHRVAISALRQQGVPYKDVGTNDPLTLDDAIAHLDDTLSDTGRKWSCESCRMEHVQLRAWLAELRDIKQERNAPLTMDELRKMSGEPVFVVTDRLKEWCLVHSHNSDDVIGGGIIMTRRTAEKRTYQYACYGKTWLAYRQKKEV